MDLPLAEKVLNLHIPLKVWNKDSPNILDPTYNKDKIFELSIMNAKVNREESDDIQHRAPHVINLTRVWKHKPFHLDAVKNILTLKAPTRSKKGKGTNLSSLLIRRSP